ncbi:MAG: hypothetical protein GKR89_09975 [Candidatus Latescibacteria bacterium]|nr:hypothetical protein [Candidatus Latescibacterota bacterium]
MRAPINARRKDQLSIGTASAVHLKRPRIGGLLLSYILLAASPAAADPGTAYLSPGDRVRLKAPGYWEIDSTPFILTGYRAYSAHPRTAWLHGSLEHLSPDSLTLRQAPQDRLLHLPLSLLTHFQRSQGRLDQTAKGAWLGAGLGLLWGGLYGTRLETDNCLGAACGLVNATLLGTALAIPSGLIGAAVGRLITWETWRPMQPDFRYWRLHRPPPSPSLPPFSANEFSIETTSLVNWNLGYARRLSANVHTGLRLGFAWEENIHSFDRNIWNVVDATLLVRYQLGPYFQQGPLLQVETGANLFAYSPQDDEDEYGDFTGFYGAVLVGHSPFYLGTRLCWGRATDNHGSRWGFLYNPLVLRLIWSR